LREGTWGQNQQGEPERGVWIFSNPPWRKELSYQGETKESGEGKVGVKNPVKKKGD